MTALSKGPNTSGVGSVLVVDDEVDVREAMALILQDHGFAVMTARDGTEAMRQVTAERPSLVLLDWRLPGQNGDAVAEAIRARHPDTVFVLITADGRSAGETNEIGKPWDLPKAVVPGEVVG